MGGREQSTAGKLFRQYMTVRWSHKHCDWSRLPLIGQHSQCFMWRSTSWCHGLIVLHTYLCASETRKWTRNLSVNQQLPSLAVFLHYSFPKSALLRKVSNTCFRFEICWYCVSTTCISLSVGISFVWCKWFQLRQWQYKDAMSVRCHWKNVEVQNMANVQNIVHINCHLKSLKSLPNYIKINNNNCWVQWRHCVDFVLQNTCAGGTG